MACKHPSYVHDMCVCVCGGGCDHMTIDVFVVQNGTKKKHTVRVSTYIIKSN